jgi:hypothetical protein
MARLPSTVRVQYYSHKRLLETLISRLSILLFHRLLDLLCPTCKAEPLTERTTTVPEYIQQRWQQASLAG